jgi:hypothetical protein
MKSQTLKVLAAVVLSFATTGAVLVHAQKPVGPQNGPRTTVASAHPFEPNEELVFDAEFSRALLKNVDVAEFRFTSRREAPLRKPNAAGDEAVSGSYSLKFTGEVFSKGFFVKLFNMRFREWMESIVEPSSFTVQKTRRVDEQGKRSRVSEAVYANGKVSWVERDPNNPTNSPRTADASFTGQVQDVLSAIYFLRTQPLAMGKTLELTISDSGRVYQVPVRVMEKKRLKTVIGRVDALRVEPELFGPNAMMDRKGQLSIWYTNDSRRIPVKARIKIEYGTINITLRKIVQSPTPRESLAVTKQMVTR